MFPLDHRKAFNAVCLQKRPGSVVPSTILRGHADHLLFSKWTLGLAKAAAEPVELLSGYSGRWKGATEYHLGAQTHVMAFFSF